MAGTRYKFIIFDLDGTLIDSLTDLTETLNYALRKAGKTRVYSTKETRQWVGRGIKPFLIDALGTDYSPELFKQVRENYFLHYRKNCNHKTRCYDGIPELLSQINSDRKMAVFSNKNTEFIPVLLNHFGIENYFSKYLGGDNPAGRKPAPGGVLNMMSELGVTPDETLIVGDMPVDIHTARSASIASCAVLWGYCSAAELNEHLPEHMIHTPSELLEII